MEGLLLSLEEGSSAVAALSVSLEHKNPVNTLIGRFLDYMVYSRGSEDDFNRFANLTGDQGWSWNEIQPYILKVGV